MSAATCPNCGQPLRAGARFCGSCGHTLPAAARPAAPPPPSEINCPRCGRALRQGARFCSSCGEVIEPAAGTAAPGPGTAVPAAGDLPDAQQPTLRWGRETPPGATGPAAPHAPETAAAPGPATVPGANHATPAAPPSSGPSASEATRRTATGAPVSSHPLGAAAPPAAAAPAPGKRPRSRSPLLPALLVVGLVGCAVLGGGGYYLGRSLGWVGSAPLAGMDGSQPAPSQVVAVAPAASLAVEPPGSAAPAASPSAPTIPAVAAATATAGVPVATALPAATAASAAPTGALVSAAPPEVSTPAPAESATAAAPPATTAPAAALTTGAPPTGASPAPSRDAPAVLVFDERFDGDLREIWRAWGEPRPTIDRGPGDAWLYLKDPQPGSAGVTSRDAYPIYNLPGAVFEFQAALDPKFTSGMVIFDWDPDGATRGPDSRDPGLIHLEIRQKAVRLRAPLTGENCTQEILGTQMHTFALHMLDSQGVALYIDNQPEPLCRIEFMGLAPVPGSISFTGLGWVTSVMVNQPPPTKP
ncbi:MAG: zinc ribbon domain-containing protein [Chloroflexota bacterium]